LYRGEYDDALRHADDGLALYEVEREKLIVSLFQFSSSAAMWCIRTLAHQVMGHSLKATESLRGWQNVTKELCHTPSRAYLLIQQCFLFHLRDEVEPIRAWAGESRSLSVEEGFPLWVPIADIFIEWADIRQGLEAAPAVQKMEASIALLHKSLTHIVELELASLLAETLLLARQPEGVFRVAQAALAMARQRSQRHFEPELFRLQGEAARAMGNHVQAEAFYRQGIASARSTGARLLELRSSIAVTRLVGGNAAYEELRAILGGFTQELDQPDCVRALHVLERRNVGEG
jgi:hypothetical protein